jgi:serine/threonine-protein kinase
VRAKDEVFERWRIGRLLGTGGMGVVHAASHTMSGQEVAIKRISRGVADQHELANRVFRETRTLARLRHANIVQLLDCGIAEPSGVYYLVMELVVGDSLRALIAHALKKNPRRGLPLRLALHVMAQVAEAMVCAHELAIVHRDLKPENVMVKPGGHTLVLDFGLAKNLGQARITNLPPDGVKSNPASVLGTPRYMAPEQVRGLEVDDRTDVYAMGLCLFESIAGCSPYLMAEDTVPPTEIMCFHVFATPTPLEDLVPEAPAAVCALIARCLAKNPADRPRARALAAALRGELAELARAAAAEEKEREEQEEREKEGRREVRPTEPMPATFALRPALPFGGAKGDGDGSGNGSGSGSGKKEEAEVEQPQRVTVEMLPGYRVVSPTFAGAVVEPTLDGELDMETALTVPRGKIAAARMPAGVGGAAAARGRRPEAERSDATALALADTAQAVVPDTTPEASSLGGRPKMRTPPYFLAPVGGIVLALCVAAVVKTRAHRPVEAVPAETSVLPVGAVASASASAATVSPAGVTAAPVVAVVPTVEPAPTAQPASTAAPAPTAAPALPAATASAATRAPVAAADQAPVRVPQRSKVATPAKKVVAVPAPPPAAAPTPAPTATSHRLFGADR